MKKSYAVEVECANCANKMELAVAKVNGVVGVSVNFLMQKMTVEFAEGSDIKAVQAEILRVCRKVEPGFSMV